MAAIETVRAPCPCCVGLSIDGKRTDLSPQDARRLAEDLLAEVRRVEAGLATEG